MARFVGDKSCTSWKYESGTYANASGTEQWFGIVQSSNISEEINKNSYRRVCNNTRNIAGHFDLGRTASASTSFWVQNWKALGFALGSIVDGTSGTGYTHTLKEMDNDTSSPFTSGIDAPFVSFTIQDAKRFNPTGLNHVKTAYGNIVNTLTLNWAMNEPITAELNTMAQKVDYSSGASWTPTPDTVRPYIFSDTVMNVSGEPIRFLKSSSLSINNALVGDFYINGSNVIELPLPTSRDYEWSVTVDSNTDQSKKWYEEYFKGGSSFNASIVVQKDGDDTATITLSGCEIPTMDDPTSFEGGQEQSITIKPTSCSVVVKDAIAKYGAW